jgi:hypothetical protein
MVAPSLAIHVLYYETKLDFTMWTKLVANLEQVSSWLKISTRLHAQFKSLMK